MSTLFALVKTHNYLIYISFPPQNRKPLCTPALGFPPPPPRPPPSPPTTIKAIIQSAPELRVGKGKAPMSQTEARGWGSRTRQRKGSWELRCSDRKCKRRLFPGQKVSPEPPHTAVTELDIQFRHIRIPINSTRSLNTEFWLKSLCPRLFIMNLQPFILLLIVSQQLETKLWSMMLLY